MALSGPMHPTQGYLNFHPNKTEDISIDQFSIRLKQFDCSIHNCSCKRSKTGLVLYPTDLDMKNTILLVCQQCYNYKLDDETPHDQLEKWYFNIYKDSKSFDFKSRFLQNEDNSLEFYNTLLDTDEVFNIKERLLDDSEKEIIQRIIRKKVR